MRRALLLGILCWLSACSYGPPLEEARLYERDVGTDADADADADSGGDPCQVDEDCPTPTNTCLDAACRDGLCQQVFHQRACDDNNLCTAQDTCQMGTCQGTSLACPPEASACDPAVGDCVQCLSSRDCTNGLCIDQRCVQCRDDADCGGRMVCLDGLCAECAINIHCDDDNPCTEDTCNDRTCTHTPTQAPCDDGDACTNDDACVAGLCRGQATICELGQSCVQGRCLDCDGPQDCPEGFLCSNRLCVECLTDDDARCDDGNPCTLDACVDGYCQSTSAAPAQSCTLPTGGAGSCHEGRCIECREAADCQAGECEAAICNGEGLCVRQQEADGTDCGGASTSFSCGLWDRSPSCRWCQEGRCIDRFNEACQPTCEQADALCGDLVGLGVCASGCKYGFDRNRSIEDSGGQCCFHPFWDSGPNCD